MKNCSSSNGDEAGYGEDECKHKAGVTVLAIFGFCLVLKKKFIFSLDWKLNASCLTCSLFHAEYLGLLVSMK